MFYYISQVYLVVFLFYDLLKGYLQKGVIGDAET